MVNPDYALRKDTPTRPPDIIVAQAARVYRTPDYSVVKRYETVVPAPEEKKKQPDLIGGFFAWIGGGIEEAKKVVGGIAPKFYVTPGKTPQVIQEEAVVPMLVWTHVFKPEREKEEAAIRAEWEASLSKAEQEARTQFETQIEQIKREAREGYPTFYPPVHRIERGEEIRRGEPVPEEQIQAWEKEQQAAFEKHIATWKSEQEAAYQRQIKAWRTQWRPLGLAERILRWERSTRQYQFLRRPGFPGREERPVAAFAGMVASGESLVYSVGELAGVKTPRKPPTVSGALITEGVSLAKGEPTGVAAGELAKYPIQYQAGTVIGDIILGYGIGKATEKFVVQPITTSWKGSRAEMWLIRHSRWYRTRAARAISRSEVGLGKIGQPSYDLTPKGWLAGEVAWEMHLAPRTGGVMISQPAKKAAEETVKEIVLKGVWVRGAEIWETPAGYFKETMFEKPARPSLPELIYKEKPVVKTEPVGFARYSWRTGTFTPTYFEKPILPTIVEVEKRLLPFVTQAQVTRMGILPYIPKTTTAAMGTVSSTIFQTLPYVTATGLILGVPQIKKPKPVTRPKKPSAIFGYLPTPLQYPQLYPSLRREQKKKPKPLPGLAEYMGLDIGAVPVPVVEEKPVAKVKEKQRAVPVLKQIQIAKMILGTPQPLRPSQPGIRYPPFWKPKKRRPRRKRKKARGKKRKLEMYEIVWPVAGVKTAAAYIFGKRKK